MSESCAFCRRTVYKISPGVVSKSNKEVSKLIANKIETQKHFIITKSKPKDAETKTYFQSLWHYIVRVYKSLPAELNTRQPDDTLFVGDAIVN